jgi:hypothetical protein
MSSSLADSPLPHAQQQWCPCCRSNVCPMPPRRGQAHPETTGGTTVGQIGNWQKSKQVESEGGTSRSWRRRRLMLRSWAFVADPCWRMTGGRGDGTGLRAGGGLG